MFKEKKNPAGALNSIFSNVGRKKEKKTFMILLLLLLLIFFMNQSSGQLLYRPFMQLLSDDPAQWHTNSSSVTWCQQRSPMIPYVAWESIATSGIRIPVTLVTHSTILRDVEILLWVNLCSAQQTLSFSQEGGGGVKNNSIGNSTVVNCSVPYQHEANVRIFAALSLSSSMMKTNCSQVTLFTDWRDGYFPLNQTLVSEGKEAVELELRSDDSNLASALLLDSSSDSGDPHSPSSSSSSWLDVSHSILKLRFVCRYNLPKEVSMVSEKGSVTNTTTATTGVSNTVWEWSVTLATAAVCPPQIEPPTTTAPPVAMAAVQKDFSIPKLISILLVLGLFVVVGVIGFLRRMNTSSNHFNSNRNTAIKPSPSGLDGDVYVPLKE